MIPALVVCIHDLSQAQQAVAEASHRRSPLVLLSAPAAVCYAGCGWWHAVVQDATRGAAVPCTDLLDCADAAGYAMAALRMGLRGIVMAPHTPGLPALAAVAAELGARLLTARPPNLDLAQPGALYRLRQG